MPPAGASPCATPSDLQAGRTPSGDPSNTTVGLKAHRHRPPTPQLHFTSDNRHLQARPAFTSSIEAPIGLQALSPPSTYPSGDPPQLTASHHQAAPPSPAPPPSTHPSGDPPQPTVGHHLAAPPSPAPPSSTCSLPAPLPPLNATTPSWRANPPSRWFLPPLALPPSSTLGPSPPLLTTPTATSTLLRPAPPTIHLQHEHPLTSPIHRQRSSPKPPASGLAAPPPPYLPGRHPSTLGHHQPPTQIHLSRPPLPAAPSRAPSFLKAGSHISTQGPVPPLAPTIHQASRPGQPPCQHP